MGFLKTHSGKFIDLDNIDLDAIQIEDIARGLEGEIRWNGQTTRKVSVAEHSVRVCDKCGDPALKLQALMHDASEYLLRDIATPIKLMLPDYVEIETRLMKAIGRKFGFDYPLHGDVKYIDIRMAATERSQLFPKSMLDQHQYWSDTMLNMPPYEDINLMDNSHATWTGAFLRRFKDLTTC
jgi:5'-deoxynucleotidase YfbR-like HD superfamily hydrolase